jgi:hypothetical protein
MDIEERTGVSNTLFHAGPLLDPDMDAFRNGRGNFADKAVKKKATFAEDLPDDLTRNRYSPTIGRKRKAFP